MGGGTVRFGVGTIAVLVFCAALLLLLKWGAEPGDRGPAGPRATRDEEQVSPRLAASRRLDEFDLRYRDVPPRPEPEPGSPKTIVTGHVRVREQAGAVAGHVYAVADGNEFYLLGRQQLDQDGRYEIELPMTARATVHVGVLSRGLRRGTARLEVDPGGRYTLDFDLDLGEALTGSVVDDQGRPVPDLAVFVTANPFTTSAGRTTKYFEFDRFRFAKTGADYHESYAATDARGWFRATGLGDGTYIVRSHDPRWFIRQDYGRVRPGAPDLVFTAVQALTLHVEARDGQTGEPLPEFRCNALVKVPGDTPYKKLLIGESGKVSVTWPSLRGGAEFKSGVALELTILAPGMEESRLALRYEPEEVEKSVSVRMTPVRPGFTRVRVVDTEGNHVSLPLAASLVAYRDTNNRPRRSEYPRLRLLKLDEPGLYRLAGGVGTWWASIKPSHDLGPLVAWRGKIVIPEGDKGGHVNITLPASGSVRFLVRQGRGEGAGEHLRVLMRRESPGASTAFDVRGVDTVLEGFPVGRWRMRLPAPSDWTAEVVVEAGQETTVELKP